MTFFKYRKIISIKLWKLAGHPSKPIGEVIHSNCPSPWIVKAVAGFEFSSKSICQNPDVRSNVEKIVNLAQAMSPMHLLISFIEYLFMYECLFNSLKSWTIPRPPSFFGTQNTGLLYNDWDLWMTPKFNYSVIFSSINGLWASGILNCFL